MADTDARGLWTDRYVIRQAADGFEVWDTYLNERVRGGVYVNEHGQRTTPTEEEIRQTAASLNGKTRWLAEPKPVMIQNGEHWSSGKLYGWCRWSNGWHGYALLDHPDWYPASQLREKRQYDP